MIVKILKPCGTDSVHFEPGLFVEADDDSREVAEWLLEGFAARGAAPDEGLSVLGLDGQPLPPPKPKSKPKRSRKKSRDD